jgi:hypothetical protein
MPRKPGFDLAVFNGPRDPQEFFTAGATWCLGGPDPTSARMDLDKIRDWIADGPRR